MNDELCGAPHLFVVNFQIPSYAPGYVWSKVDDGEGFNCVLYYKLSPQARKELLSDSSSSAKLLKKFLSGLSVLETHNRMKCIPRVVNTETCSLGAAMKKLLRTYNSKPFLTGPHSHAFFKGPGYIECDVDVHKFCYMARKAVYGFIDSLKTIVIDVAFVVEGHSDEELPEQVLACNRCIRIDPTQAQQLTKALQQAQITKT
jgi:hypothetical protein